MDTTAIKANILAHFKINNADPAAQEAFFAAFEDLAQQVTITCILENLDHNNQAVFLNYLTQENDEQKAINFARQQIPNLDEQLKIRMQEEVALITPEKPV